MTGTFSIKLRKQPGTGPRPHGQSSQLGVLSALGLGGHRPTDHPGSKRGHVQDRKSVV